MHHSCILNSYLLNYLLFNKTIIMDRVRIMVNEAVNYKREGRLNVSAIVKIV